MQRVRVASSITPSTESFGPSAVTGAIRSLHRERRRLKSRFKVCLVWLDSSAAVTG